MPEFWQFLYGLLPQDLIAELVQNDLDAGANRTRIAFEKDRFTCEGDGAPVDAIGWKRLAFIRGAGDEVPCKVHRIGVKNHGLKTCFALGDEITLSSAGRQTKQTLYCNGRERKPRPGAFVEPVEHPAAPPIGCRIEVPYRTDTLVAPVGERLVFSAPTAESIEMLFRTGCVEIPERFIGAIRPVARKSYILELSHHRLGSVRFSFRCGVTKRAAGGVLLGLPRTIFDDPENFDDDAFYDQIAGSNPAETI